MERILIIQEVYHGEIVPHYFHCFFLVFAIFVVSPSIMAAEVEDGKNW
jgi:hypothetical protein